MHLRLPLQPYSLNLLDRLLSFDADEVVVVAAAAVVAVESGEVVAVVAADADTVAVTIGYGADSTDCDGEDDYLS